MICPVCGTNNYQELDYGGYRYLGFNLPLVFCRECGLKYIIHSLNQATFDSMYNQHEYFESEYEGGALSDYVSNQKEIKQRARRALRIIQKEINDKKLLEIGSAGGYFLEVARDESGFEVVGIELSREMAEWSRKRSLTIYNGLTDLPAKEKFNIVYMGDVLEHIPQPKDFIKKIEYHLEPNGFVVLELPLTFNLSLSGICIGIVNFLRGKIGFKYFLPAQHRKKFLLKPPYHLIMFNRPSIKKFFDDLHYDIKRLYIYEGGPKEKFKGEAYWWLKKFAYYITYYTLPFLGDRMIVIAQKSS